MRLHVGAALALLLVSTPARADDGADARREPSRAAFRRGVAEAQAGRYAAARDAFAEAYRLFPHPSILLNLGIARWRVAEYVEAEQDLARFLSDDGGASSEEVSSARAALGHVREHLGTLRVRVIPEPARAELDGRALRLEPAGATEVRAVAGAHVVRASADLRATAERRIDLAPGAVVSVDLALPPPATQAGEGTPRTGPRSDARVVAGWSLLAAAVGGAVVGTYAGVRALSLADDYGTPGREGYQDPGTRSSGITLRTAADVAFGASIVTGAVGACLLVVSAGSSSSRAAVAWLGVGPSSATFRGTF